MKNLARALLLGLLLTSIGCGRNTTVTTSDGSKVHVEQSGQSVTVTTDKGTVTAGTTIDVEKTFGIPPYPGATQQTSYTGSQGDNKSAVVMLQSKDAFDKVLAFYKDKFPKANVTSVNSGGNNTAVLAVEGKAQQLTVSITSTGEGTTIQIASSTTPGQPTPETPASDASPSGTAPGTDAPSADETPTGATPASPDSGATPQESPSP